MHGSFWRCKNDYSLKACCAFLTRQFAEHGDLIVRWQIGTRSLDQNALFHAWCREWVAAKLRKRPEDATKAEIAGMKRTVKKIFYLNTGADWMVCRVTDYSAPNGKTITEFTSSADWASGEMFQVLSFMQMAAAEDGVLLESLGKFQKMQQKQYET